MQALLVVDAQNEFSDRGLRPVPNHAEALRQIMVHVNRARENKQPIAWIQHPNKPHESNAFAPGTWGAELSPALGAKAEFGPERLFVKDVYGAFSAAGLDERLRPLGVNEVLTVGFYADMCLSRTVREALIRDYDVLIDPQATGACDLNDESLGSQSADEVRRSALLHLRKMCARLASEGVGNPHCATVVS